ncbi:AAA family ATPase [Streptomyces sp. NPDC015171]|uniref:AAA family ATPase n=1 Tax=Streptomyces sp. NPDC015171 TaxID=3364945 RepID=UPI0036F713C4
MTTSSSGGTAGPDHSTRSRAAWVYHGTGVPRPDMADLLPPPPPWRSFHGGPALEPPPGDEDEVRRRLGRPDQAAHLGTDELAVVNAALILRRPLLVTGLPGTGKSTLPYQIAYELGLGRVLYWPISSRTTLLHGLYQYDAIGRVQATATWRAGVSGPGFTGDAVGSDPAGAAEPPSVGSFVGLGPLGTALLPFDRPRVLLVDELDKSDIDLPNDLLSVFEEGSYEIPELVRSEAETVQVRTDDPDRRAPVHKGRVRCRAFPIVVITSNGERDFPPAFLRRCLRLDLPQPSPERLAAMVAAHFSPETAGQASGLIQQFLRHSAENGGLAIDQLLNAVHLVTNGRFSMESEHWEPLLDAVWRALNEY